MKKSRLAAIVAVMLMSGCASGSAIVTGTTRPAVTPDVVKIYMDPPAEYVTIGLVRASSSSGFTQQGDLDYAVKELKRRAAKMGANGVLLSSTGSKISSAEAQAAEGRAIFVSREK
jgi:hypothetical protein